jgi:hypothetical protein
MIGRAAYTAAALPLVLGTLCFASVSRADEVTVVAPAPVVVAEPAPTDSVRTRTESTGPDMRMIGGGIVTFGVSYGVAIGVAATSGHQGDGHLYVPLVGPWLDFGDRGNCPQTGSCDKETTNRVFIVVDGVFQAIGVLSVVSGLLFHRTHEVTTTTTSAATKPTLRITPEYTHGGPGLVAVGTF